MAARTSTGAMGRGPYPNTAISRYGNMDLGTVVAVLEALDLAAAPPEALVALLAACAAIEAKIAVHLATAEPPAPVDAGPERLISVAEAAARLAVKPQWIYEH